ncbi:hypothetical protein [Brevundimonas sp.]|uniref:hypothetical protein n=1 Tax=Brevundimonas sp. TaxID=1871086 RepID=UPI002D2D9212|nr:hypothetical protein [Brevundimonas sp.]HYD29213.1 hypothetical protein [Brevundimonas sp.]
MRVFRAGNIKPRTTRPILLRLATEMRRQRCPALELSDRHGALSNGAISRWLCDRTSPPLADLADVFSILGLRLDLVRRAPPAIPPSPRFTPHAIPPHAHPLVRRFYAELNRTGIAAADVADAAGLSRQTLVTWKISRAPLLVTFERALTPLGLAIVAFAQAESRRAAA